jgi:hypothetical protein
VNVESTTRLLTSLLCFVREELEESVASCALFAMDEMKIARDIGDWPEKHWMIAADVLHGRYEASD